MGEMKVSRCLNSGIILLVLWLGSTSCNANSNSLDFPGFQADIIAYLPFVENVHIPDTIIAGNLFQVTIELSAQRTPAILNGYELTRIRNIKSIHEPQSDTFTFEISTWYDGPFSEEDPVEQVTFSLGPIRAGTHKLIITTASSRENGGKRYNWQIPDAYGPYPLDPAVMPTDPEVSSLTFDLVVSPE